MARRGPYPQLVAARVLKCSLLICLGCGGRGSDSAGNPEDRDTTDADGDGYSAVEDCDDTNPAIHPDADELCDGLNNDCDAGIDEDAIDSPRWYRDADGDGYGNTEDSLESCDRPPGYESLSGDCNDTLSTVHPGAPELCDDGQDNDCDPATLECEISTQILANWASPTVAEAAMTWTGNPESRLGSAIVSTNDAVSGASVVVAAPAEEIDGMSGGVLYGLGSTYSDIDARVYGESSNQETGSAIERIEDVDGDGYDDLFIGAPGSAYDGTDSGMACLLLGPLSDVVQLSDSDACYQGEAAYDRAGLALSAGADLDGDGVGDLLIGATGRGDGSVQSQGAVYVLSTSARGTSSLSEANLVIHGPDRYDRIGTSVAGPVDLDGDGRADLLVGAGSWDGNDGRGGIFALLGPLTDSTSLEDSDAWISGDEGSEFGSRILVSDLNGDGYDDIISSGPGEADGDAAGAVWIFSGPIEGTTDLDEAVARIGGSDRGAAIGSALAIGELNGDSWTDLAVGAPHHVHDGHERGLVSVVYGPIEGRTEVQEAHLLVWGLERGDELGSSIAIDGSDGESTSALWIGAPGANDDAGMVLLVHGR